MDHNSANVRPRSRPLRSAGRVVALVMPLLFLSIVLAPHVGAAPSANAACENGPLGGVGSLAPTGQTSSVTAKLLDNACATQQVSLVSYQTEGPDYNSAGTETRFDLATTDLTAVLQTLNVLVPGCFFQVDLIYGADAPTTLQHQELYFTRHGTLIASYNGGTESCAAAPPENAPNTPAPVEAPPSIAIDLQSASRPPVVDRPQIPIIPPTPPGDEIAVIETSIPADDAVISPSLETSVIAQTFYQTSKAGGLPFTGLQLLAMALLSTGLLAGGISIAAVARRRPGGRRH